MSTDQKTINSYNKFAKKWRDQLSSKQNLAHEYLEKPAMYEKLRQIDVKDKRVLCIGVGTGEEAEYIRKLGASCVIGIDISSELVKLACESYPNCEFHTMDMENLLFNEKDFDIVYSSLTLHYVKSWSLVLGNVRRVLKDDGRFLFSTHNPVKWCGEKTDKFGIIQRILGFSGDLNGEYQIHGNYLDTYMKQDIWFNELEVTYYNKPFSVMYREILEARFSVADITEPKSVSDSKNVNRGFYDVYQKIPFCIIFEIQKSN